MSTRRQHTAAHRAGLSYALIAVPTAPIRPAGRATGDYHCPSEHEDLAGTVLSILLEEGGHAAPEMRV